jgi:mercuric ion binding protein
MNARIGALAFQSDKKEAVVTYDDAKTGVEALTKATDGAGYPSEVKQ